MDYTVFVTLISLYCITISLSITTSVLMLIVHERETYQTEEDVEDMVDETVRSNKAKKLKKERDIEKQKLDTDKTKKLLWLSRRDRLRFNMATERIRRASKVTLLLQLLFSLITSTTSAAFLSMTSLATSAASASDMSATYINTTA